MLIRSRPDPPIRRGLTQFDVNFIEPFSAAAEKIEEPSSIGVKFTRRIGEDRGTRGMTRAIEMIQMNQFVDRHREYGRSADLSNEISRAFRESHGRRSFHIIIDTVAHR